MNIYINYLIIFLILVITLLLLLKYFFSGNKETIKEKIVEDNNKYHINYIVQFVKNYINDITRTNLYELGLGEEEFRRRLNKRSELKKALKNCTYGSKEDKEFVKDFMYDLLRKKYINEKNIDKIIPFNNPKFLNTQDRFDILIYLYKKSHNEDALKNLIDKYKLDRPKKIIENESTISYIITKEEIEHIYKEENTKLSFEDKLKIVVQRVYQIYKGFGVIDEIRDMNIDGISGGVSGVIDKVTSNDNSTMEYIKQIIKTPNNYDSIWIFYKGKSIHLSFLTFGSEKELIRICQSIYRYNKAGQLSQNVGYKVNEMKDGSRVVVVRPNFSESWAFFIRKFHIANVSLEGLIRDENCELPINILKFLVKGARVLSITGAQGTGKTTLLMAMVRNIYATLTLRVQEMAFELHLRKVYPMRNILTFKETDTISGQEGLDVQKKTDGSVNILGEVATDEVCVWMLQMAQVASLFTLFTHHAKTASDLILSLRNSLLKCEVFNNEKVAEQQVVGVLNFDIHLEKDYRGNRYIERITEIIELDESPYPNDYKLAKTQEDKLDLFMDTMTEYFTRKTDRKMYITKNIVEFKDGEYVVCNKISDENIKLMKNHMTEEDKKGFEHFINKTWGDYSE
jgi:pilus assembly protein CpaF